MAYRTSLFRYVRLLVATATVFSLASLASAEVHVRGYTRSNGTYVAPHNRSNPDGNFKNNWSTKGNVNPYTGKAGTRVTPPAYTSNNSSQLPAAVPQSRSQERNATAATDDAVTPPTKTLRSQLEELKQRGVDSIIRDRDQYVAIIGDRVVHVGDELNGFTVTSVEPNGVHVESKATSPSAEAPPDSLP